MSFNRFVYYSAVIGAWSAFVAWMLAEPLYCMLDLLGKSLAAASANSSLLAFLADSIGRLKVMIVGAMVGAAVGAGVALVAGLGNAKWVVVRKRLSAGLLVGGLGGLLGAFLGDVLYAGIGLPRPLGWMVMGLAIGCTEGLCDRSVKRLRNGLIGGGVGGLLGGVLFETVFARLHAGAEMSARAVAFVVLGASVGALIGLAQVVLKEAWLTVVDGFRPGRQLILGQPTTVLGRGDHLAMPFLGYAGRDLESEHAKIVRLRNGSYTLEDNRSRIGTRLNGQFIHSAVPLRDGDLIRLGGNIVRFGLRHGKTPAGSAPGSPPPIAGGLPQPPAPPQPAPTRPVTPPLPGPGIPTVRPGLRQAGPVAPPSAPPRIPPPPPPPPQRPIG